MKSLLLVMIALVGTACVNPQGTLSVREKLSFKRKTFFGNTREVSVKPGTYSAKITLKSKKKAKMKISGLRHAIIFKIPKSKELSLNGETFLTSSEVGQPYDVLIDVETIVSEGAEQRERMDCTIVKRFKNCKWTDGTRRCHFEERTLSGKKRVIFKMVTTVRDFDVKLWLKSSNVTVGHFVGSDKDHFKDIIYESVCHPVRRSMLKRIPFGDF